MFKLQIEYNNEINVITCNRFKRMSIDYPIEQCKFTVLYADDKYDFKDKPLRKISGIYKISRNDKCYIGQSIDILHRWDGHIKGNSDLEFHRTLKKYLNEFTFEIIELVNGKKELNEREIYWINYFDSYHNGFNQTPGGDGVGHDFKGEKHHNCKVSEEIVKEIRIRYNNKKETFRNVYKDYKHLMKEGTFKKIWNFTTWKHIYPEFHNHENSQWHIYHMNFSSNSNPRKILSNDERNKIRQLLHLSDKEIYEQYFSDYSKNNFMRQVKEIRQYTNDEIDFIHNKKFADKFLVRYHLTEDDVKQVRQYYFNGYTPNDAFEVFKDIMSRNTFNQIWCGRVVKTIDMYVYDKKYKDEIKERGRLRDYHLTHDEVVNIRKMRQNGRSKTKVFNMYKDRLTFGQFSGIWGGSRLKNIKID